MRLRRAGNDEVWCTTILTNERRCGKVYCVGKTPWSSLFHRDKPHPSIKIMNPKPIIIDTDPGVDEAFTFLLALASPEIKLEALTTTQGNVTVDKATHNALSVLELGRASHIPVVQGSVLPLVQPLRASAHVHGESGIGNAQLPKPQAKPVQGHAVDYLIERVLAEPGAISIFPIGPMTNIAIAIRKEPAFAKAVKELIIMGGAIREGGNMTPLAEFNIY